MYSNVTKNLEVETVSLGTKILRAVLPDPREDRYWRADDVYLSE